MAKRFTDTNKWRKGFIRGLQGAYKLLWLYILDECDHAGIWHVELDVAELRIGMEIDQNQLKKEFKNHIVIFDEGKKWFIPDFIEFQYGVLNPENRVHCSVIDLLKKYNLKVYASPLQRAKDKDKDKDKGKAKDKEKTVPKIDFNIPLEERRKVFHETIKNGIGKIITREDASDFYRHWAAIIQGTEIMKFETMETWSINLRIGTWIKNKKVFGIEAEAAKKDEIGKDGIGTINKIIGNIKQKS